MNVKTVEDSRFASIQRIECLVDCILETLVFCSQYDSLIGDRSLRYVYQGVECVSNIPARIPHSVTSQKISPLLFGTANAHVFLNDQFYPRCPMHTMDV